MPFLKITPESPTKIRNRIVGWDGNRPLEAVGHDGVSNKCFRV